MFNFVVFFFCWFTSLLYILLLINLCCVFLKLHKQCVCFCLVLFIFLTWQIFTRFQFNAKLTHSLVLANFENEHKNFDCNTQNKIQKFRILIIYFFLLLFFERRKFFVQIAFDVWLYVLRMNNWANSNWYYQYNVSNVCFRELRKKYYIHIYSQPHTHT